MSEDRNDVAPRREPRLEQAFPTLTRAEIARMRGYGSLRAYADGAKLVETGVPGPGMFVVLSGRVAISQRDGLGHVYPVADQGAGQFVAEVGQLSGRVTLVDAVAIGEVETLLIPPDRLRALIVAEADLGERVMRALILRRVSLIDSGAGGPVLVGAAGSPDLIRLMGFLARNGFPYHWLDPASDHEAAELIDRYAAEAGGLPLVVNPDGAVLHNPSEAVLARRLGMTGAPRRAAIYDVAVVGAGPAGLATAVYAASEGLSVVVLDARAYGGQAGASARIENFFGFPTGISGPALTARGFVQAQKFGAEILIPATVKSLDCTRVDGAMTLQIEDDGAIRARAIVVATGARYRRPAIPDLASFEGRGVWYWASRIEAKLCADAEVLLVGGGNSAGQAAVFLSGHARKVRMMVRARGLAESMSRYLIDRIAAAPNIELMTQTEVVALDGGPDGGLRRARWRDHASGSETEAEIRNLFLFVGADPATGWLEGCGVALDRSGFVTTGADIRSPLESSVSGVFAVGDVRSGSVKRVGGAIGEGAQVVQAIHGYLARGGAPGL